MTQSVIRHFKNAYIVHLRDIEMVHLFPDFMDITVKHLNSMEQRVHARLQHAESENSSIRF